MNQRDNVVRWTTGVDAITVVGRDHHAALPLYNLYDNFKVWAGLARSDDRPFTMHGYRGKQCGSFRVGLKDDKCLLMVTGPFAERAFKTTRELNVKYTRVDLQITLEMEWPIAHWAIELYESPNLTGRRERGKLHMSLVQSNDGSTLYINKRTSPTYTRMYDKSQDYMGPQGKFWRFEVEAKEETADKLCRVLENVEEREDIVADYVATWYAERDICVPVGIRDTLSLPESFSGESGFAETLAWLNRQVRPSLNILMQAGLTEDAEKALGIQLTFPESSIDQED